MNQRTDPPDSGKTISTSDLFRHYRVAEQFIRDRSIGCFGGCRQGNWNFFGWWKHKDPKPGRKRRLNLADHDDYLWLTRRCRALYWTTSFFSRDVFESSVEDRREVTALGGPSDINGITAFTDIDLHRELKPRLNEKPIRTGLEYAICFVGRIWGELAPTATYAYASGGGAYVLMAPTIIPGPAHPNYSVNPEQFRLWLDAFQLWLLDIEREMLETRPSLSKILKMDRLNHPVRLMKTVWAVHKSVDVCCAPLDAANPRINMQDMKVPVKPEIIKKWEGWMDLGTQIPNQEVEALTKALEPYLEKAKELRTRGDQDSQHTGGTQILGKPVPPEYWPPCIRWVIHDAELKFQVGGTRALAFLAAFLGMVGWTEEDAYRLWEKVAHRFEISSRHYFSDWFRVMTAPSCQKIVTEASGYPEMTMGELKICRPDNICRSMQGRHPVSYVRSAMAEKGKQTIVKPDPTRASRIKYRPRSRRRKSKR